jgi:hypothetical protein
MLGRTFTVHRIGQYLVLYVFLSLSPFALDLPLSIPEFLFTLALLPFRTPRLPRRLRTHYRIVGHLTTIQ